MTGMGPLLAGLEIRRTGSSEIRVAAPPPLGVETVSRLLSGQFPSHTPLVAPEELSIRHESLVGYGTCERGTKRMCLAGHTPGQLAGSWQLRRGGES